MLTLTMAVEFLGAFASDVLIAYAWTRLLRMRSNILFWLLLLPFMIFIFSARSEVGSNVRLLFLFMSAGLLPFLISVDRPLRKLLVIALVNVSVIVAEAISISLWCLMTGLDVAGFGAATVDLGAYTLVHIFHFVVLMGLLAALRIVLDRFDREQTWALGSFVWFPVVQMAMLTITLAMGVYMNRGSSVLYFGTAVLSLVCLVADAALFVSMDRYARKRREDQRAALLQQQLGEYLERCDEFVAEAEHAAWMRHDARNQAQAAIALADRGDFSQARLHLSTFLVKI